MFLHFYLSAREESISLEIHNIIKGKKYVIMYISLDFYTLRVLQLGLRGLQPVLWDLQPGFWGFQLGH